MFFCKGVFHKVAVDILWPGSLPTRIPGGTVTICDPGNTPLLYHPSLFISPLCHRDRGAIGKDLTNDDLSRHCGTGERQKHDVMTS